MKNSRNFLIMFMCFWLVLAPLSLFSLDDPSTMAIDQIMQELIQNEIELMQLSTASIEDLEKSNKQIQIVENSLNDSKQSIQQLQTLNEKLNNQISTLQIDSNEARNSINEIFNSLQNYKNEQQKAMIKTNLIHFSVEAVLIMITYIVIKKVYFP